MNTIEEKLGYKFKNRVLLKMALTHSSYANENKKGHTVSNERLEFLGDSVLGMTVAEYIYRNKPKMPEGQMTKLRAELVCEKSLAMFAETLGIGEHLLLGRGEEKCGGRTRPSILADAVEALIAAVYLDGGMASAAALIERNLPLLSSQTENYDYKTALQELVQEKSGRELSYHIIKESGPDHMKSFSVEVRLNGALIGSGTGKSKKEAEQAAAQTALAKKII